MKKLSFLFLGFAVIAISFFTSCRKSEDLYTNPKDVQIINSNVKLRYTGTTVYHKDSAAKYAKKYFSERIYLDASSGKFPYFSENCTNFISQCILAGLMSCTDLGDVWDYRWSFVDQGGYNEWYYKYCNNRSASWAGVHELYNYSNKNLPSYSGLHLKFVTRDTPDNTLDVSKVQVGDIIFVDTPNDLYEQNHNNYPSFFTPEFYDPETMYGHMNHALIVVKKKSGNGYSSIKVAGHTKHYYDRSLATINANIYNETGSQAVFHVYRPLNFVH